MAIVIVRPDWNTLPAGNEHRNPFCENGNIRRLLVEMFVFEILDD